MTHCFFNVVSWTTTEFAVVFFFVDVDGFPALPVTFLADVFGDVFFLALFGATFFAATFFVFFSFQIDPSDLINVAGWATLLALVTGWRFSGQVSRPGLVGIGVAASASAGTSGGV